MRGLGSVIGWKSAKGVKCNSLGQRPRRRYRANRRALKERNESSGLVLSEPKAATSLRAFSASSISISEFLGRCPRLLHFAPLALKNHRSLT